MILSITGSLSAFEPPYVITSGANGTATFFVVMNDIAHTSQKVGLASAMAVFLLTIIIIAKFLQDALFRFLFRNAGNNGVSSRSGAKKAPGKFEVSDSGGKPYASWVASCQTRKPLDQAQALSAPIRTHK